MVEDIPLEAIKNTLKNEAGIKWIVKNKLVPLGGGETVLPLDGGETVLPLDGGETVLPLDSDTDKLISQLLDGGETVLPLEELKVIRAAYENLSKWVTPSKTLLLQASFRKIGLYLSVGVVPGFGHGTRVASLLAVTSKDIKASFSNYGKGATLSAPGYGLWTAYPNHMLSYVASTSYASPIVAAQAALMMLQGVQSIDSLNPQYYYKLGRGRIFIPWALNSIGIN